MTNGEKFLKDYYPNSSITRDSLTGRVFVNEDNADFTLPIEWWDAEYKEPTTKNDLTVEKIIDEIEEEFEKVDISIMDKLTLFAKVQNSLYKCAELRNLEISTGSTIKNDLGVDCISRNSVLTLLDDYRDKYFENRKKYPVNHDTLHILRCIRNLPSVTPQPCEDAVSRRAVLDLIADYDLSMGQVVRGIHALPSATPQDRRKGHWIDCKCDKCGYVVQPWNTTDYCPNCGADMREVEE